LEPVSLASRIGESLEETILKKLGIGLASLVALAFGACFLLPERFVFNAPAANLLFGVTVNSPPKSALGGRIQAARGFTVGFFAVGVPNARFLRFTPDGDLLVSQPRKGQILLLEKDADGDGMAEGRRVLLEGLNRAQGLDFHNGWLYIAEGDAIARIRYDSATRSVTGALERIVTGIPSGGNHWARTLRVGRDGWLYVSVGSSCNVCEEDDPRRAAILRYRLDGSGEEIFAAGLRNTMGFDWQPGTGKLFGTDNGRDLLGDDFPPCELNQIRSGGFYGWPYANGDNIPDPDFGRGNEEKIRTSLLPAHGFRAHNAPLGMTFIRGSHVPAEYRGAALVALHGSWNRSEKDGYKVVSLHWPSEGGAIMERDFLWGFELNEDVIGRPVDVIEGPDGAFYVSDDYARTIYRVVYDGSQSTQAMSAPATPRRPSRNSPLAALGAAEQSALAAGGEALFEKHQCAICHKIASAQAGIVPIPLSNLDERYDIADLQDFFTASTPPMPLFDLSTDERRELAVYLLERFGEGSRD